jgi:hypothetical protein
MDNSSTAAALCYKMGGAVLLGQLGGHFERAAWVLTGLELFGLHIFLKRTG